MNPDPSGPSGKAHWRTDALLLAALLVTLGGLFVGHHLAETWPEQAQKHSEELRAELAASLAGVAGEDLSTVLNRQLGQLILDPFDWPTVAFAYVEGQGGMLLAGRVNLPHFSCPNFDQCYGTEKEVLDEVRAGRYFHANQYNRVGIMTHRLAVEEIETGAVLVIGQKTVHVQDRLSESRRFGQRLLGLVLVLLLVRIGSRLAARMVRSVCDRRHQGDPMSLDRIAGMVLEFRQVFRDPRMAMVIFVAPVIQLLVSAMPSRPTSRRPPLSSSTTIALGPRESWSTS